MMKIREWQDNVREVLAKIDKDYAGEHDADTTFVHLIEELGELSTQIYNKKIGREEYDKELLESGIVDCIFQLLQLGNNYDIDVESAMERKNLKVRERFKL
jgi:NTP pyrophosphatase (non-canonical NTP hydrolase)